MADTRRRRRLALGALATGSPDVAYAALTVLLEEAHRAHATAQTQGERERAIMAIDMGGAAFLLLVMVTENRTMAITEPPPAPTPLPARE